MHTSEKANRKLSYYPAPDGNSGIRAPIPAPKRNKVPRYVPRQLDRLEARKVLAIAKVVPKLVGVEDVAEAEEILEELRDEMLDELDAIERELGLIGAIST